MLSVDHSNIDGPPLAVKCVIKFGSALGGEVTSVCVSACAHTFSILSDLSYDWRLTLSEPFTL